MHYFIFPTKDSSIYSESPTENAGIDEILEISCRNVDDNFENNISRALIQFNIDGLSGSLSNGQISSDAKYFLNLYTSDAFEIPVDYTIYAYPISGSWTMGTGRRNNLPITNNGVCYNYRDGENFTLWDTVNTSSLGGKWISGSGNEASQSFSFQTTDLHMDVTDIVNSWVSGTIENNGFILKFSDSIEQMSQSAGTIKFFSNETHTIYRPRLEVVWVDADYSPPVTESRSAVTSSATWVSQSILYNTVAFYSGGIGSQFIQSGSSSIYSSASYSTSLVSQFEYLSNFGYYISSSYVPNYDTFIYISASVTAVSQSVQSYTTSSFRTGSLGSEFAQSASSTTWQYFSPVTSSNSFTLDSYGIYVSESISQSFQSYIFTSSSITGYTSQSIPLYTVVDFDTSPVIAIKNIQYEYLYNTRTKFRIAARDRFPRKTFTTGSWQYSTTKFLPSSSYYSIRDEFSEEEIIPFSKYSQISADNSGSYFNVWLDGLEPERFYRILLKINDDGLETIYDKDYRFRIIR